MPPPPSTGFPEVFHLGIGAAELDAYAAALGIRGRALAAETLALAIAADPWWQTAGPVRLVVGSGEAPTLSVLAKPAPGWGERLTVQAAALRSACRRVSYLTYPEVSQVAAELAQKLRAELGDDLLRQCEFAAIPRGGWLVLGLLAYQLGLSSAHLVRPVEADAPVVVVDDCVLSGARFGQWLSHHADREVIFAHLFSHPEARAAIREQEPTVRACLAARDFRPAELDEPLASEEWEAGWRRQLSGRRYWLGRVEHLCFPWSEPERVVVDPTTGELEAAWRLLPPDFCLSNKRPGDWPGVPVSVLPASTDPVRPCESTVYGQLDGQWVAANLAEGTCLALPETAGEFWEAVVSCGTRAGALAVLRERYPAAPASLSQDFEEFVEALLARGLLKDQR